MSEDEFYRIKRLPPYVFAEVNRLKAKFRAEGMDIIDFGMGNPDMDTPRHIVEKLVETAETSNRAMAGIDRELVQKLPNMVARLESTLARIDSAAGNADAGDRHIADPQGPPLAADGGADDPRSDDDHVVVLVVLRHPFTS